MAKRGKIGRTLVAGEMALALSASSVNAKMPNWGHPKKQPRIQSTSPKSEPVAVQPPLRNWIFEKRKPVLVQPSDKLREIKIDSKMRLTMPSTKKRVVKKKN